MEQGEGQSETKSEFHSLHENLGAATHSKSLQTFYYIVCMKWAELKCSLGPRTIIAILLFLRVVLTVLSFLLFQFQIPLHHIVSSIYMQSALLYPE